MRRKVALLAGALLLLTGCDGGHIPAISTPTPRPDDGGTEAVSPAAEATPQPSPTATATPVATPAPTPSPTPAPLPLEEAFADGALVDLSQLSNDFVLDMKYATHDNFTGIPHYNMQLALLHKDAAALLLRAQEVFTKDGYRIVILDAYRPYRVQESLYEAVPPHLRQFVAKPSRSARHCKGIAVDMTLCDAEGRQLPMPSAFDTFDESAYVGYAGGTQEERDNRDYMVGVMESCGFTVYDKEWWHYAVPALADAETRDITFEEFLEARAEAAASVLS